MPKMVICCVKTAPVLYLWWWIQRGLGVILTPGDGVQMSASSLGATFVKQSLSKTVIFPVKTAPVLHLWCWILVGMRGILTAGDGVQMFYILILESLAQFYPITYISLNLAIGSILSYSLAYCLMSAKVAKYSLYPHA